MTDRQADKETGDGLREWLRASPSVFDILVGRAENFPDSTLHIDTAFLEREFPRAFPTRMGGIAVDAADEALQRLSLIWAERLARTEASRLDVSVQGLRHAWFLPVTAELVTLVPLRHLARKLHAAHPDRIFAITLEQSTFSALKFWRSNELEPLYLAHELRRRGARVCLRIAQLDRPELTVALSPFWRRKWQSQFRRDASFSTVLCEKNMRNDDFAAAKSGATHRLRPGPIALLRARRAGRAQLTLKLRQGPSVHGLQSYAAPADMPTLPEAFAQLMGPATRFLSGWIRASLRNKPVQAAHIADHASFDGGLLAAEVVRQGGKLHLWPHSANAVDVNVHDPETVAHVTLAARSTAAVWAQRHGWDKLSVDVRTILPDMARAPGFDATQPLHVVLFGGAHSLHRLPMVPLDTHKASWRKTLSGLRAADATLSIKHKSQWETRDWIRQMAEEGQELQFSRTHATKLSFPNMVFLSISLTSTALLEGIARGIPAIVIRDVPVRETPHYDPDYVPCIPSHAVAETLERLKDRAAWEALRDRQAEWLARETS